MRNGLNPAQFAAVSVIDGPVLVIAGAGSGKTRVIEYRVLNLVEQKINPRSILLLTFTRKAAREMLSRAERHNSLCAEVEGGTFHSFGFKLLKRYAKMLDFPASFSVLDEADSEEAIHRCCTQLGFFQKEKRFPHKDTLRSIVSKAVNKKSPIKAVLQKEFPHFLEYTAEIKRLARAYTQYKLNKNFLDYDDLLVYLRLLLEKDELRVRLAERYRYIMVDEYQDTNPLQGDITYLLAKEHHNIMAVGDDAQSIYGFRGTSHENIMDFPRKFPRCKIIKLEENYRSTQSILDVSNAALENMQHKYAKCLVSARKVVGEPPQLLFFKDPYEEAGWIAGQIKQRRDEGLALSQQAVLFRSAYISIPLQAELSRRNLPYQVFGGLKFYETAHVKDLIAHLKVLFNPRDELSWNRALMLIEGIGPKTAQRITDELIGCADFDRALKALVNQYQEGYRFSQGLKRLETLLRSAYGKKLDAGRQYGLVLDYYEPLLKDKFDDWPLRLNDLATLRQISLRYASLGELLTDFAMEPPERGVAGIEPGASEDERPLVLSTIHSAKGLEWDSVFLIGLTEGLLPVSFALDDEEELEEEHRLFYVGITRAKNRLFLSMHHEGSRGGITQFNKISRFIDVPNILSKLETKGYLPEEQEGGPADIELEGSGVIYDKPTLFKRVVDYFDE